MCATTYIYGTVQASKPPKPLGLSSSSFLELLPGHGSSILHLAILRTLNFGLNGTIIGTIHWFVNIASAPMLRTMNLYDSSRGLVSLPQHTETVGKFPNRC